MKKLPIVAIIGRPNIGKSTLFNKIIGHLKSVISDTPGTTRDRVYDQGEWNGHSFIIVDTAGIETDKQTEIIEISMQQQVQVALHEANYIFFGLDGGTQLFPEDRQILKMLYTAGKPFSIFINKIDSHEKEEQAKIAFQSFENNNPFFVSAKTGKGLEALLDNLVQELKNIPEVDFAGQKDSIDLHVALIGKPNVGKSSLLNVFLNREQVIVSDVPGTTRDSIDAEFTFKGQKIQFVDTAGIRRKARIKDEIERFSVFRSLKSIEMSDIVLLVIDALEGPSHQDMTISEIALDFKKSIILVINKWDLVEKDQHTLPSYEAYLRRTFGYLKWVPILFTSASEKIRTFDILNSVYEVGEQRKRKLSTSEFNNLLQHLILKKPPASKNKKLMHPKMYYGTQTGINPPEFTIFMNKEDILHNSYTRYLENAIREKYGFLGTPVSIHYRYKNSKN